MMKMKFLRKAVCAAIAGSAFAVAPQAAAIDFNWGDVEGSFDTTISWGLQWRVSDRDNRLIGKATLNPAVAGFAVPAFIAAPGAFSSNGDRGNMLYNSGDVISNTLKVNHDLSLRYGNVGFFGRAFYFQDFKSNSNNNIPVAARERVGRHGDLLDAFVFGDWTFGENDQQFSLRVGRQVVSWGESTFIQGGINVINPVDLSRLRVPGAELKEALLPVNSIWSSISFTDNLSLEVFLQAKWKGVIVDPAGTYWSTSNFIGRGHSPVLLGFGQLNLQQAVGAGASVGRAPTPDVSDSGQYGLALRWFNQDLDTEFGFFALRYHSRLPVLSGIGVTGLTPSTGRYFTEFPEGIRLFGVSFNTVVRGIALQGEYSYRPNAPLQVDDAELLFAALSPLNPFQPPAQQFLSQLGSYAAGAVVPGFVRHKVGQLQFTATYLFGQDNPFGGSNMVLLGEVGVTRVFDMPAKSVLRYEGPGTSTGGGNAIADGYLRNPVRQTGGFADATSWGYRVVTRVDYNNVIGAWNMSPRLSFQHDVSGTSPGPGGNFIEGRKSISIGVNANYLEQWAVDLSYTNFSGAGTFNQIRDRDFVAIDFKYSF